MPKKTKRKASINNNIYGNINFKSFPIKGIFVGGLSLLSVFGLVILMTTLISNSMNTSLEKAKRISYTTNTSLKQNNEGVPLSDSGRAMQSSTIHKRNAYDMWISAELKDDHDAADLVRVEIANEDGGVLVLQLSSMFDYLFQKEESDDSGTTVFKIAFNYFMIYKNLSQNPMYSSQFSEKATYLTKVKVISGDYKYVRNYNFSALAERQDKSKDALRAIGAM